MNNFLDKCPLSNLNQYHIINLNRFITPSEIEAVDKSSNQGKKP